MSSLFSSFPLRVKPCLPSCYQKEKSALDTAKQVRSGWSGGRGAEWGVGGGARNAIRTVLLVL